MSDWKERLRDFKKTFRMAESSHELREKPLSIDFSPPDSWLADKPVNRGSISKRGSSEAEKDRPAVKNPDDQLGKPREIPTQKSPVFRPIIDGSQSLSMPDWAYSIGKELQHPLSPGGPSMTVRVGVDFGTAFTKVAIRLGKDLVVVDWSKVTHDDAPTSRWIVPGSVCRNKDGRFGWRRCEDGEWLGNLKLPLMEAVGNVDCPIATLAYLASVIRYSRAFLYASARKLVTGRSLRWELNFGCPTEPHEKPVIVDRFRRVALTAWWLAGQEVLNETTIRDGWDRDGLDAGSIGLETEPAIVPEFVAQIAGYLRSPQVSEGLHALVDVGAATMDVATFNVVLSREGDMPRVPIFFSAVKPLGTHFLLHRRHERLGLALVWNDAMPVEPAADLAFRHGVSTAAVQDIDDGFAQEVACCVAGVMNSTRTSNRGDPRSIAWREGLPVFVTGGGSACDVYRMALQKSEIRLKGLIDQNERFKFIEMALLRPTSIDMNTASVIGLDEASASRLTVAIGLTEDAEDIAHIVPHCDIEPIVSPVIARRSESGELYPK